MEEMPCIKSSVYGPFQENALQYWKESLENSERVCFVMYEEMREQPQDCVMQIAEFLGFAFIESEIRGMCFGWDHLVVQF